MAKTGTLTLKKDADADTGADLRDVAPGYETPDKAPEGEQPLLTAAAVQEEGVPVDVKTASDVEVVVEDDTPPEDRGRQVGADPQRTSILDEELEEDDLDKYSKEAKDKLIRMKRVYHDERRAKEAALREHEAAIEAARALLEENQRMKATLQQGVAEYRKALEESVSIKLALAKRAYKEAYDAGDSEALLQAQEAITQGNLQLSQIRNFQLPPDFAADTNVVQQRQHEAAPPKPDHRALQWQKENPWFGQDDEMTATALGLHEKLRKSGVPVGSDEYYAALDNTMRMRFPEKFREAGAPSGEARPSGQPSQQQNPRLPTTVAPATRSTGPKRVRLTQSQVAIAKRLGIPVERYAQELLKLKQES